MGDLTDILWFRTWWSWRDAPGSTFSILYRSFNLLEGTVWLICSLLVLRRRARQGRSVMELWYALAFALFALTDFREAWYQQSWLIWVKGLNLVLLFGLRRAVLRRYYPDARVY